MSCWADRVGLNPLRSTWLGSAMKAIVQTRYGSPDVLQLKDVDKPSSKPMRCWYAFAPQQSISATGISSGVCRM